jgi:hypothetical protein
LTSTQPNGSRTRVAHISIVHPPTDTRIFVKQCRSHAGAAREAQASSIDAEPALALPELSL